MNDEGKYGPLRPEDVRWAVRTLPKDVKKLLERTTLMLGGGYLRARISGEPVNDIDLFGPNKGYIKNVVKQFEHVYETDNAYTVKIGWATVQFIHRWTYLTAANLLDEFDFTIACAVVWYNMVDEKWHSMCHPDYYSDLAARRLVYLSPQREEEAGGSFLRMLKFTRRGYRASLIDMGKVIARLTQDIRFAALQADARDPREYEQRVAQVITGRLYEVDPSAMPTYYSIDVPDEGDGEGVSMEDAVADAVAQILGQEEE